MTNEYEASDKSPAIDLLLSLFAGTDRKSRIAESRCVLCNAMVPGFRDELSEREYRISGMCQTCQDEAFGDESDV